MNVSLFKKWWLLTVKGCLITAFGALLLVNPYATVSMLVLILGITLIVVGTLSLFLAYYNRNEITASSNWFFAEGFIEIIFGLVILLMPTISLLATVILSGIWLIIGGAFQIGFGFRYRNKMRGWKFPLINGILALLIGLILALNPLSGVLMFAVVTGITLLTFGLFLIVTSVRMRRHLTLLEN